MTMCSVKGICVCSSLTAKTLQSTACMSLHKALDCSDSLISHRNSRRAGCRVGSKCHFCLFSQRRFHQKLAFPHVLAAVSTRLSRCPGYCAESQIIASLLLLLKRLSPLICSGGLQFFFSNAISFSGDGTAPNDPNHCLASLSVFLGPL